jgi:hypothetical protein
MLKLTFDKNLLAVLGISAMLLILVAVEPFGADNAVLHSMAIDLVKFGKVPYVGSWDNNFPGIIYIHALSILIFGTSDVGYRLFDICIELAFSGFLYRFLIRWLEPEAASLAAVLYVAYYVSASVDLYGKQDAYGTMAMLVGLSFILAPGGGISQKWMGIIAGGVISGIAILMRPTFLLYIGLLVPYIVWLSEGRLSFRCAANGLLFFVASLIPVFCVVAYYALIPKGLTALYDAVIRFNLDVYAKLGTTSKFWWEILRSGLMIPLALFAILASRRDRAFLARRPNLNEKVLYVAFILSALGIVVLMGKYYRYHLAPFYILMVPLSAAGLEMLISFAKTKAQQRIAILVGLLFCSFIGYNPTAPLAFARGLLTRHDPFVSADNARRTDTLFGAIPELALREYLNKPENREGAVEICSFSPFLRYHLQLQRHIAGPYITFHALAFRTDATRIGVPHYTSYQLAWQKAYLDTLCAVKPHFIILARRMPFWYIRDVYDDCLHYLPGFDSLISSSYSQDTTFGGFQVLRRNK